MPPAAPFDMKAMATRAADGMMQRFDANKDGIISKDEWMKQQEQFFDAKDSNHDNKLTKDEIIAEMNSHMPPAPPAAGAKPTAGANPAMPAHAMPAASAAPAAPAPATKPAPAVAPATPAAH
jgi:hypothetical protein